MHLQQSSWTHNEQDSDDSLKKGNSQQTKVQHALKNLNNMDANEETKSYTLRSHGQQPIVRLIRLFPHVSD